MQNLGGIGGVNDDAGFSVANMVVLGRSVVVVVVESVVVVGSWVVEVVEVVEGSIFM